MSMPLLSPRHDCPMCQRELVRIPRQFGDRLISLFVPVLRMQCRNRWLCGWQGLVRRDGAATAQRIPTQVYGVRTPVEAPIAPATTRPSDTPEPARHDHPTNQSM